jgi:single-strand DNA-binding protein
VITVASINRVIMNGRLVRDPELRYTASGTPVANFTIAVDRFPKPDGTKDADFVRITAWKKLAETCASNLMKGRLVGVDGRLQVRTYQDKDGQNRTSTEIVAENIQFLDSKKISNESNNAASSSQDADSASSLSPNTVVPNIEWEDEDPPF